MKKLIFSLFAIATIFVACDKDSVEIAPVVEVEEMSVDTDALIDGILSRWGVNSISSKNSASSSKTNNPSASCADDTRVAPDASTDYISYEILSDSDGSFGLIRSEERSNVAAFDNGQLIVTLYFTRQANNVTHIYVGSNKVAEFTSTGFDGLYDIANALAVESLTSGFIYTGDTNLAAAGLECTQASGLNPIDFYTVTDAPFPLTGKLATINSGADFPGSSANYAGTTEASVRAAIEADILDGN